MFVLPVIPGGGGGGGGSWKTFTTRRPGVLIAFAHFSTGKNCIFSQISFDFKTN